MRRRQRATAAIRESLRELRFELESGADAPHVTRLRLRGDRTGLEMIRTLQDRAVSLGIEVYMECTVTRLITGRDGVTGAFGYWRTTGRPIVFPAKAVVLATGGIGRAYEVSSNSWEYSGDGQALAYLAGADLIDMEFVQFHPTALSMPGQPRFLLSEALRGEGARLLNAAGEPFMVRYDPAGDLAPENESATASTSVCSS